MSEDERPAVFHLATHEPLKVFSLVIMRFAEWKVA